LAYYPTSDKRAGARAKATALLKMKRLEDNPIKHL